MGFFIFVGKTATVLNLTCRAENDPRIRASTQAKNVTVTAAIAENPALHEFVWTKMGEIMDMENSERDCQQQR